MKTGTIGDRLRAAREKLGFSQVIFAEKTGVTSRSQRNYEMGTRVPDALYLASASKCGIDIHFVLTGDEELGMRVHEHLLLSIGETFGISYERLEAIVEASAVDDDSRCTYYPEVMFSALLSESEVLRKLVDQQARIDKDVLFEVLDGVEKFCLSSGLVMTPEKKAGAVSMLYRSFKVNGKVDPKMIEDAVTLAAG